MVGGFLATNDTEPSDRLAYLQNAIGAVDHLDNHHAAGFKTSPADGPPLRERPCRR